MASGEREFVLNTPDRLGNPIILGAEMFNRKGYLVGVSPKGFGADGALLEGYRAIYIAAGDSDSKRAVDAFLEDDNIRKLAHIDTFGIGAFVTEEEDYEYQAELPDTPDTETRIRLVAFGHYRFAQKAEAMHKLLEERDPGTALRYYKIAWHWRKKGHDLLGSLKPLDIDELRGLVEKYTLEVIKSLD